MNIGKENQRDTDSCRDRGKNKEGETEPARDRKERNKVRVRER